MATHYVEFDSNSQALLEDLRTEILKSSDWTRLTSDVPITSMTAASSANSSAALQVASTAGLESGMTVTIDNGSLREYRVISSVNTSSNTISLGTMTFAHALGTEVRAGSNIYKATTTRGAEMVIDLSDGGLVTTAAGLNMAVYQSHDGIVGTGKFNRYLNWRYNSSGSHTHPLHVTLSLGKEHFFLGIEGPRAGESGSVSSQYGSFRNYTFLSDVIPYDPSDAIPVVYSGGAVMNASSSSLSNSSHMGNVSLNLQGTSFWTPARLASLQFPMGGESSTINVQRQRQIDGKYILAPYVMFSDSTGMRGRLSSFFFAGFNSPSEHEVPPPPIGTKVEYQGRWYKLVAVSKGDGSRAAWGEFGGANNDSSSQYARSPVVAVPCP